MIFRRKIQSGQRLGRTIGFPTLNMRVGSFGEHYAFGVYACRVWISGREYRGALHFGPKFSSRKKAHLEIHVIGFKGNVYGQWTRFEVGKKIRGPKQFDNLMSLKKQIEDDLKSI